MKHVKPERVSDNPLSVQQEEFWKERIIKQIARGGMLHQIVYDNSYDVWLYLQAETGRALRKFVTRGARVLDCGCGYGAIVSAMEEFKLKYDYTGIDISPDLIRMGRYRYGDLRDDGGWQEHSVAFVVGDLRALPFPDGWFDHCIARSVEGMILENYGADEWAVILREMKRVAQRSVVLLDYPEKVGDPVNVEVVPV